MPTSRPGWALFVLTAISTCGFIDRVIMSVLVHPIKAEFRLSDTEIGLVGGFAFALLNVLLGIWVARIAEQMAHPLPSRAARWPEPGEPT